MNSEITKKLDEIAKVAIEKTSENDTEIASLKDRIEQLEAGKDIPRGVANEPLPYNVFNTEHGKLFKIPGNVKMADIRDFQPEQKASIGMDRWLHAAVTGDKCQDKEALEYFKELKSVATTSTGVLIPQQYMSEWIDLIRAQSVLNAAGMTTIGMEAKTQNYAAVTADPTASWHAEAGSISATDPTFAARTLTANTIVVRVQGSVEVAQDSPNFGQQLGQVMTRAIAAEIDRAGLHGSGSGAEPAGIYGASGISTVASVGVPTKYDDIISGLKTLMESNNPLERINRYAIMSPRTWATYEGLATGITSDNTPLPRPKSIEDMEFLVTTNVSNTLDDGSSPQAGSAIFLGDFTDLYMGIRREASIETLKLTTYASNLLLEFVAYARVDFMLARPASFLVLDDVQA